MYNSQLEWNEAVRGVSESLDGNKLQIQGTSDGGTRGLGADKSFVGAASDLADHFDAAFYRAAYPDAMRNDVDPLTDYWTVGWAEGRDPRPDFSTRFYLGANPDVAESNFNPFWHYVRIGRKEGRSSQPSTAVLRRTAPAEAGAQEERIGAPKDLAVHFDAAFYRAAYPDAVQSDVDPLMDYWTVGWAEGRDPHPDFSTAYYLETHPDVAESNFNPFWHYIRIGRKEGRSSQPSAAVMWQTVRSDAGAQDERIGASNDLADHFDAAFYRAAYPDAMRTDVDPLTDYWTVGWAEGRDPHPGFSTSFYLEANPDVAQSNFDPFWHYIRIGQQEGRQSQPSLARLMAADPEAITTLTAALSRVKTVGSSPADRFREAVRTRAALSDGALSEAAACLSENVWFDLAHLRKVLAPELGGAVSDAEVLRVWLGKPSDKRPPACAFFKTDWYLRHNKNLPKDICSAYCHYIRCGITERRAPFPAGLRIAKFMNGNRPDVPAALERCPAQLLRLIADDSLGDVPQLLQPELYRSTLGLPADLDGKALLFHYIATGWESKAWPTAVFDPVYYAHCWREAARKTRDLGGTLREGVDPFLHWMVHGAAEDVMPTPFFDADHYRAHNPDLKRWSRPLFIHFWLFGMKENRRAHPLFDSLWYAREYQLPVGRWALLDLVEGADRSRRLGPELLPPLPSDADRAPPWMKGPHAAQVCALQRRQARLTDPEIATLVAGAAELEPLIMHPAGIRRVRDPLRILVSARLVDAMARLQTLLPARRYDTVVLIPHCRMSGAARVAGWMTRAVADIDPDGKLLVVLTDADAFERPDWFSPSSEVVSLMPLVQNASTAERETILHALIRGVAPKRVINVNSKLGWSLYTGSARTLKHQTKLYAYLFCWDLSEEGNKGGYPINEFQKTFDHLAGVFVDSIPLRRELATRYMLGCDDQRLQVLHTPSNHDPSKASRLIGVFERRRAAGISLRCMWASRMDRQKRFDIVIQIARAMPNLEIEAWGKPVLAEKPIEADELPPNVTLMGTFDDFGDLPLDDFDFLLYTSEWDGVPTILIDAASVGLPIVASAVGGVGDLVDGATGWPVAPFDEIARYVAAVEAMVRAPETVTARTVAMQARIADRFASSTYIQRVATSFLAAAEPGTQTPDRGQA